ncbi:MAG: hypothetical protein MHMPM18_000315 [Marteilia pararefringens]
MKRLRGICWLIIFFSLHLLQSQNDAASVDILEKKRLKIKKLLTQEEVFIEADDTEYNPIFEFPCQSANFMNASQAYAPNHNKVLNVKSLNDLSGTVTTPDWSDSFVPVQKVYRNGNASGAARIPVIGSLYNSDYLIELPRSRLCHYGHVHYTFANGSSKCLKIHELTDELRYDANHLSTDEIYAKPVRDIGYVNFLKAFQIFVYLEDDDATIDTLLIMSESQWQDISQCSHRDVFIGRSCIARPDKPSQLRDSVHHATVSVGRNTYYRIDDRLNLNEDALYIRIVDLKDFGDDYEKFWAHMSCGLYESALRIDKNGPYQCFASAIIEQGEIQVPSTLIVSYWSYIFEDASRIALRIRAVIPGSSVYLGCPYGFARLAHREDCIEIVDFAKFAPRFDSFEKLLPTLHKHAYDVSSTGFALEPDQAKLSYVWHDLSFTHLQIGTSGLTCTEQSSSNQYEFQGQCSEIQHLSKGTIMRKMSEFFEESYELTQYIFSKPLLRHECKSIENFALFSTTTAETDNNYQCFGLQRRGTTHGPKLLNFELKYEAHFPHISVPVTNHQSPAIISEYRKASSQSMEQLRRHNMCGMDMATHTKPFSTDFACVPVQYLRKSGQDANSLTLPSQMDENPSVSYTIKPLVYTEHFGNLYTDLASGKRRKVVVDKTIDDFSQIKADVLINETFDEQNERLEILAADEGSALYINYGEQASKLAAECSSNQSLIAGKCTSFDFIKLARTQSSANDILRSAQAERFALSTLEGHACLKISGGVQSENTSVEDDPRCIPISSDSALETSTGSTVLGTFVKSVMFADGQEHQVKVQRRYAEQLLLTSTDQSHIGSLSQCSNDQFFSSESNACVSIVYTIESGSGSDHVTLFTTIPTGQGVIKQNAACGPNFAKIQTHFCQNSICTEKCIPFTTQNIYGPLAESYESANREIVNSGLKFQYYYHNAIILDGPIGMQQRTVDLPSFSDNAMLLEVSFVAVENERIDSACQPHNIRLPGKENENECQRVTFIHFSDSTDFIKFSHIIPSPYAFLNPLCPSSFRISKSNVYSSENCIIDTHDNFVKPKASKILEGGQSTPLVFQSFAEADIAIGLAIFITISSIIANIVACRIVC